MKLFNTLIDGFEAYTEAKSSLDVFDLVLWAVCVGAFRLAKALWARSECESPLRLSLLVQDMCKRIRLREKKLVGQLDAAEKWFNQQVRRNGCNGREVVQPAGAA